MTHRIDDPIIGPPEDTDWTGILQKDHRLVLEGLLFAFVVTFLVVIVWGLALIGLMSLIGR